jgi:hypothetical protein
MQIPCVHYTLCLTGRGRWIWQGRSQGPRPRALRRVVAAAAAEEPKESSCADNEVQKATAMAEYTGWDG